MILSMKRITLVAHKADEPEILRALQALDAVEIIGDTEKPADRPELFAFRGKLKGLARELVHGVVIEDIPAVHALYYHAGRFSLAEAGDRNVLFVFYISFV